MGRIQSYALAGALTLVATAAGAADMLPPPPPMPMPPPIEVGGGWYLRGDLGISNQDYKSIDFPVAGGGSFELLSKGLDSAGFAGAGFGYQFNGWLRADITGEYRGKSTLHGLERYPAGGGFVPPFGGTDEYHGSLSSVVTLANLYVDLGTWHGITPFIGAGVGGAYNMLDSFMDVNTPTGGVAFADANAKWNLAWAVHAGLAYKISPSFTLELAYRYLNLGDARTGTVTTYTGACGACNVAFKAKDIDSHDVKIGLRWAFGGDVGYSQPVAYPAPMAYPAPLVRKY